MKLPDAEKVLIYAYHRHDLLVFDEPDFAEVPLQVPGGTVEPGEDALAAARREFFEETGLEVSALSLIRRYDYRFSKHDRPFVHRRHVFAARLAAPALREWIHLEEHSFDGAGPIRFRLHFVDWRKAEKHLGLGMEEPLSWPELREQFA